MGLSVAIGGSMAVITLVMSLSMFPMMIEDIHDTSITNSDISQIQKKTDKTDIEIRSIDADVGSKTFTFILKNTGSEKIWNYENFDFFVNYDANVSKNKVRLTEQFSFNETGSFLNMYSGDPIFLRPFSDIAVGSWQEEPLYEKLDEQVRDDGDFVFSPLRPSTPTNDVEVKFNSTTDPEISYGHHVRYSYRTSDVVDSEAMVVYGEKSVFNPTYRTWTNSTEFSAETSANNIDNQIISVVLKASPISEEKILVTLDSNDLLNVQTWDGSSWVSNWNTTIGSTNNFVRVFDVAYEESSGDVLVVFGDDTTQLKYRKRVNDSWDKTNQNAGSLLADSPNLVIAKSHPTSDNIFVGILTNSRTLEAMRWNGLSNSWDNQIKTTAAPTTANTWVFDITYERNSGDAFLLWGQSLNLKSKEFTTSWATEQTALTVAGTIDVVTAGYDRDPTSNTFGVGINTATTNNFVIWDGSTWTSDPIGATSGSTDKVIGVDFEKTTGQALFVFIQGAPPVNQNIAYKTWDPVSGFSTITTETGGTRELINLQVYSDPLSNDIMVLFANDRADLFYQKWNGESFSPLGSALNVDLSSPADQSYTFAWNEFMIFDLDVELRQGSTVIAQWDEGNPFGTYSFVEQDRELSFEQTDSITDYSDLRIRFKVLDGQFEWSWAEFYIGGPPISIGEDKWVVNLISNEILDPKVLNPNEEALIIGQLRYPVYPIGLVSITIISDTGVSESASVIAS